MFWQSLVPRLYNYTRRFNNNERTTRSLLNVLSLSSLLFSLLSLFLCCRSCVVKNVIFLSKCSRLITIPDRVDSLAGPNSTAYAAVFMISADCGYPLRLLPAVNEKKKRQRESRPSESTEFGRCGARISRKRRHLIVEAYMEAFIRPKRECINSWANLFRNNRAKFRTAREISRMAGEKERGPTKFAHVNRNSR